MKRDEIRAAEKRFELDLFDPQLDRTLLRQERIVGDDSHLKSLRSVRHDRPDIAATYYPVHFSGDLHAHETGLLPISSLRRLIGGGDLAGASQEHGDGVLGRRD